MDGIELIEMLLAAMLICASLIVNIGTTFSEVLTQSSVVGHIPHYAKADDLFIGFGFVALAGTMVRHRGLPYFTLSYLAGLGCLALRFLVSTHYQYITGLPLSCSASEMRSEAETRERCGHADLVVCCGTQLFTVLSLFSIFLSIRRLRRPAVPGPRPSAIRISNRPSATLIARSPNAPYPIPRALEPITRSLW